MPPSDIAAAEASLRALLRDDPANSHAIHDLGLLAHRDGRRAEALHLLRQALALQPENLAILKSCAQVTRENGDPAAAAELFHHALDLDPRDPLVWNAAGVCLQESGQAAGAMEAYLRALALNPASADLMHNIGNLLQSEGDLAGAMEYFEQAIALAPGHGAAHTNLAIGHRNQLNYPRATLHFHKALEASPTDANIAMGYGEILSLIYNPQSEAMLRHAVALEPAKPECHWNLALDLLKRGSYGEGFAEYEWRWRRGNGHNTARPFALPVWNGDTDISAQTLLVHAEQGFGDTIQMLRYLPLLRERTPSLILEVQPELTRLVATLPGVIVLARGEELPHFDTHIAMMSLPLAFGTDIGNVPAPLRFPVSRFSVSRLPVSRTSNERSGRRRVGISWSGNPHHDRDRERSIPFASLAPLFAIEDIDWISLQPASISGPLAELEQHALSDFMLTAELLETLDLVITVDSSVAHLALTQHVPTCLLLPFAADWRWLSPGHTAPNPWYPEVQILRQASPSSGWQPVLEQLQRMLTNGARWNP